MSPPSPRVTTTGFPIPIRWIRERKSRTVGTCSYPEHERPCWIRYNAVAGGIFLDVQSACEHSVRLAVSNAECPIVQIGSGYFGAWRKGFRSCTCLGPRCSIDGTRARCHPTRSVKLKISAKIYGSLVLIGIKDI